MAAHRCTPLYPAINSIGTSQDRTTVGIEALAAAMPNGSNIADVIGHLCRTAEQFRTDFGADQAKLRASIGKIVDALGRSDEPNPLVTRIFLDVTHAGTFSKTKEGRVLQSASGCSRIQDLEPGARDFAGKALAAARDTLFSPVTSEEWIAFYRQARDVARLLEDGTGASGAAGSEEPSS
jgi:hypothetical protein